MWWRVFFIAQMHSSTFQAISRSAALRSLASCLAIATRLPAKAAVPMVRAENAAVPMVRAANFAMPKAPAIGAIVTGFLVPTAQYSSYAELLDELSMPSVIVNDGSTLGRPTPLAEAATNVLSAVDAAAKERELEDSTPLVLIAHSRGAKAAVLAAQTSSRPVAAMILLDPVDATLFEGSSVLSALRSLRLPVAILGSGAGQGECAPIGSNYAAFWRALEPPAAEVPPAAPDGTPTAAAPPPRPPRLLAVLGHAGHMQFLDHRGALDVCTAGQDDDPSIREVALAVVATWLAAFVPGTAPVLAQAPPADRLGRPGRGGDRPAQLGALGRAAQTFRRVASRSAAAPSWAPSPAQTEWQANALRPDGRRAAAPRDAPQPRGTSTIGSGRVSARYLLLAARLEEVCADAAMTSRSGGASSRRVAACVAALQGTRFRAQVEFTSDGDIDTS